LTLKALLNLNVPGVVVGNHCWHRPAAGSVPALLTRQRDLEELQTARAVAKLEGTWLATFGKYNGVRWSPGKVLGFELRFTGSSYQAHFGDGCEKGTYRPIETRQGYALDLEPTAGPLAEEVVRAIYRVDAKCLMLCLAAPGENRPAEFSAEAGSGQILIVLRPGDK